ncbi:PRD domain-containing protein [Paenibacillus lignilyticus]|uniref:PRD domain-containing protein n=1 Tax=Paenibacillus lignilyticus TaxID=1172615 RepID=A0ABS5C6B3_9BACL|nr:PRD domain-containing protein [Paenibacillus lignilyticus]
MGLKGLLGIDRIVGNNVLLTIDPASSLEYVLFGKGIGFAFKGLEHIDAEDPRIEKRYRLDDKDQARQYHTLLEELDPAVIQISEQIIDDVQKRRGSPVDPKVYFALPSHIQFAVYRLRNGMDITNPFLYETKMCYPQDYDIATRAAEMISNRFDVVIPEDEIGFLTFHIHSASGAVSAGQLVRLTEVMHAIVERIESWRGHPVSRESGDYVRLITHLRYALERIIQHKVVDNPFVKELWDQFPEELKLARQVAQMIHDGLGVEVPQDEIGYLMMHLYRLNRTIDMGAQS